MSTIPHNVLVPDRAKGREGEYEYDQSAVALDGIAAMVGFLHLDPHPKFDAKDAETLTSECDRLASACGQMNSGQEKYKKRKSVDFSEIPHIQTRICTLAMRLVMSGKLNRLVGADDV